MFNACITLSMICGAQTWALGQKDRNRLKKTQNKIEKGLLGITERTRIRTEKVNSLLKGNNNIVEESLKQKWDWAVSNARKEK